MTDRRLNHYLRDLAGTIEVTEFMINQLKTSFRPVHYQEVPNTYQKSYRPREVLTRINDIDSTAP
eukprot:SAG11_NODE_19174_length_471_cov_1.922252_1_plen_65_part_00